MHKLGPDRLRSLQRTSATELVDEQTEAALVAAYNSIQQINQIGWVRPQRVHDFLRTPVAETGLGSNSLNPPYKGGSEADGGQVI